MEDYRSWLEKAKMNAAGVDRDIGEKIDYLSDEEELNKTGYAPAILSDDEDDSFSGSEVSSVEGYDEADQMGTDCVITDEKAEPTLKDEHLSRKQTENVSELLCLWQCAVCGKKIKGTWPKRRQHIETHEKLYVDCPISNCSSELLRNLPIHLKSRHKTTKKALSTAQKADVQSQIDRNVETAIRCEMKYFPPSSLISSSETAGREGINPYCKKCGSRALTLSDRRNHVAIHMNLNVSCPHVGCSYNGRIKSCFAHFYKAHGAATSGLKRRLHEHQKFAKARKELYAKVDLVMSEYFA
ncbi:hypothetical protein QR680_006919 [Steinernema hermaphroditum]|uniref:C2H2-type domain-containing protein n=1 Tax=Steinernema hermaphroditum TaxID=289476 RepID=A0AA39LXA0_9BILA|nr:hypothetical protein QR680_006919 [Steinernema hermaphroditum]